MVTELADLGDMVAPSLTALLEARKQLRAFIGHVEPTFNWPLRAPDSQHALTSDLVDDLLYTHPMLGRPLAG